MPEDTTQAMLDAWFTKPRMAPPASILHNVIYVALDPNAGANKTNTPGSDTAIVSFFITNGNFVVGSAVFIWVVRARSAAGRCTRGCARRPTLEDQRAATDR